ncbi:MAG: hypothetical protein PT120_20865 [Aphanizomenon gracile PMC649.10]|nr:hypothetical protein [Aphanizomenon gracile PMC649.10]
MKAFSKSDRTSTNPKTANCLQQRFAIALPHPQKRSHPHKLKTAYS